MKFVMLLALLGFVIVVHTEDAQIVSLTKANSTLQSELTNVRGDLNTCHGGR